MLLQKRKGVIKRIKAMNRTANNVICVSYQTRYRAANVVPPPSLSLSLVSPAWAKCFKALCKSSC